MPTVDEPPRDAGGLRAAEAPQDRLAAVAAGRRFCPHCFIGGLSLLASLHVLAAAGGTGLLELDATVLDAVVEGRPMTPVFDPEQPITQPALLLAADPTKPDCVARAADTEQFARVSPHAQVVTVTGAGHLVHDELAHRDEFLRHVLSFLATLD